MMRITTFLLMLIVILLGFIAYSQGVRIHVVDKQKPIVTEKESQKPPVIENEKPPKKPEVKHYENNAFKEVVITEKEGKVVITGKARVFEGVFQYAIVNSNETLLQDKYLTEGAPAWGEFEISFDKKLAANKGTTLELFVYSAKDGAKTDVLVIPISSK